MQGVPTFAIAAALVVAACAPTVRHWSPFAPPRSEEWHSGRILIANYDSNGDGTVTRRELEAGLRQYFRQADSNRDGRLDADEVAAVNQRRISQDESAAMPLIDWNQDGY